LARSDGKKDDMSLAWLEVAASLLILIVCTGIRKLRGLCDLTQGGQLRRKMMHLHMHVVFLKPFGPSPPAKLGFKKNKIKRKKIKKQGSGCMILSISISRHSLLRRDMY